METTYMRGDDISASETHSRWVMAVLSANQGVWDHDFECSQHYLSDTWRKLRGLASDDEVPLTTEKWLTTIHESDIAHLAEEWRRIDSGETDLINYKFRQLHKEGHWVWFLSRGRVVRRDAAGLPARIIGTDTDITDIKTVELEKQRLTQRLEVAMEAARMGRWELDLNTGMAYWDNNLLHMLGIRDGRNNRLGHDWLLYIHPDDRAEIYPYLEDRVQRNLDIERDYRILRADGETIHIRALAKFTNDIETGPCYFGVNYDITLDKQQSADLERARALLEYESRHDALTKLANRRRLDEDFLSHAKNMGSGVSVLHFDIDHFKQINDTLGHDAGDATLQHAANVLQRHMTGNALVSRVGGDEFVGLLFDTIDEKKLLDIAEAIIHEMSQPFYYGSQKCTIGTSIGIATCNSCEPGDSSLFINADLALYEAKKAGRGRYRFYSPLMKEQAHSKKRMFDALLVGVSRGEIQCHYQPQFDAETMEVSGLEALVRWDSETFGLMMPHQFLSFAEEMGILSQVDDLVLRRVLFDIERWESMGLHIPPVSVNVSSDRLNDPMFADQLRTIDIPKDLISFELLESAFLDTQSAVVSRNLNVISEMGIMLEIDDFGSGHASIASLLSILPTRLKIDREIVSPIAASERQRDLVRNIIGIGHMLGIKVVAEGVETLAHIEILQAMRCDFLQGFGLARPMDGATIDIFLASNTNNDHARKLA